MEENDTSQEGDQGKAAAWIQESRHRTPAAPVSDSRHEEPPREAHCAELVAQFDSRREVTGIWTTQEHLPSAYELERSARSAFHDHSANRKQDDLDAHAKKSASGKRLARKRNRTLKDPVEIPRHVMAKPIRNKVERIEKCVKEVFELVHHVAGVDFEPCFFLRRNVATPQKAGLTAKDDCLLSGTKLLAQARNESALQSIVGEDAAAKILGDAGTIVWFHEDHPDETYSENRAKQRAREKVKTSEETSQGTCHTSCTVDLNDL